jgi:hypothetical protein
MYHIVMLLIGVGEYYYTEFDGVYRMTGQIKKNGIF